MRIKVLFVITLLSLVILSVPAAGCAQIKEKVESMKPEIRGITLEWGEVTPTSTEVLATINVYNPNQISLPVKKVACDITMSGIRIAGAETANLKIEKNAEFPVKISAKIDNTKIPEFWVEHLRHGEKSEAIIDLSITFDLGGMDFTFPVSLKQPIETNLLSMLNKVGPVLIEKKVKLPLVGETTIFKISLESLSGKWGTITRESIQVNLVATILNENPYPLPVPKIGYVVDMNGIALASGETETDYLFAPNSKNNISTTLSLDTTLMDKWFVTHIRQNERSIFNVQVSLIFELPKEIAQPLGQDKLVVPVWEGSQSFETNILRGKK